MPAPMCSITVSLTPALREEMTANIEAHLVASLAQWNAELSADEMQFIRCEGGRYYYIYGPTGEHYMYDFVAGAWSKACA
jgi:hypothetical protein